MKKYNKKKGIIGENIAMRYLKRKGYLLVDRNYRNKLGEIDIIMKKGKILVFIEVKSLFLRENEVSVYSPEDHFNSKKRIKVRSVSNLYIKEKKIRDDINPRIDLLSLTIKEKSCFIRHYKNCG